jgi:hypothetical protein
MVHAPEDYPWSGQRAYLGIETIPWLTTDWALSQFGKTGSRARLEYRKFVASGQDEVCREEFHGGRDGDSRILGDDSFTDRVLAQAEEKPMRRLQLEEIIALVCREYGIDKKDLATPGRYRILSEARGMAALLILETGCGTVAQLGKLTGRDVTTLSTVAKHLHMRAKTDIARADRMKGLLKSLREMH